MLLDTASLYFRAFFGVPDSVRAPDGTPVNAVRGFLDALSTLIKARHPDRLVCALDYDWRPAWRVALLPSYKAQRVADESTGEEETPDLLTPQVAILLDVLDAYAAHHALDQRCIGMDRRRLSEEGLEVAISFDLLP